MTGIVVTGASGKMGSRIATLVAEDVRFELVGLVDQAGSKLVGKSHHGVVVQTALEAAAAKANAIIDFTVPQATLTYVKTAQRLKKPMVIGTTGLTAAEIKILEKAASDIAIVFAPNMSLGVNALFTLVEQTAKMLKAGYDIEVIEAHHRAKRDAPSGTAVRLAQILAESTQRSYPGDVVFSRQGEIGPRTDREIGMQVIRGGDIVGEHTVMFCGQGERIELKHVASSRDTFARGAMAAALWLVGKKPGLYDMQDVLGM